MELFNWLKPKKELKTYMFVLGNGYVVHIDAENVIEAVNKFKKDFPDSSWTIKYEN